MILHCHVKNLTSRSEQIFENQPATMTKSARRVAHEGRLAPSYPPSLGVRLVMQLSYASSKYEVIH